MLFVKSRALLHLMVFLSPFTASTIVISEGSRFGMQPAFWFGLLFAFVALAKKNFRSLRFTVAQIRFTWLIAIFLLYSGVSLTFPFIQDLIGISPTLINPGMIEEQPSQSGFQIFSLTQFAYLTFYLLVSFCVMIEVRDYEDARSLIRTLIISAIVTVLWGLGVQYSSFFLGFQYPDWIFNNHPGYSQGFEEHLRIIPRLSSVAPEPSMFGYFLLIVISLLLTLNLTRDYIYGRLFQKSVLLLLVFAAVIGTSSTAYVGLLLVGAFLPISSLCAKKFSWGQLVAAALIQLKYVVYFTVFLLGLVALVGKVLPHADLEDLVGIMNVVTLGKMDVGSGVDRFAAFLKGLEILVETSFIGTGWGSNSTFDLFSTLLANIGIVGFVLFLGMIGFPLYYCWSWHRRARDAYGSALALGLVHSIIIGLALMFLSVPGFIFMFFWIMFGLLLAWPKLRATQITRKTTAGSYPRSSVGNALYGIIRIAVGNSDHVAAPVELRAEVRNL